MTDLAIATYADLKATALDFLTRATDTATAAAMPVAIKVAEARLNRKLGAVETDASLTGTTDSRTIDVSSLSIAEPIALYLAEASTDEREIQLQGGFERLTTSGRPAQAMWDVDAEELVFDRPLDGNYPFRLRYRERFALSDSATTNWLLTNHPDVYLAATLMWGAGYNEEWPSGQIWKAVLDEGIAEVQNVISRQRKGVLRVDPGLLRRSRPTYAELVNGDF